MRRERTITQKYDGCDCCTNPVAKRDNECKMCEKDLCGTCSVRIMPPAGCYDPNYGGMTTCPACKERYDGKYKVKLDALEAEQDELWTAYWKECKAAAGTGETGQ